MTSSKIRFAVGVLRKLGLCALVLVTAACGGTANYELPESVEGDASSTKVLLVGVNQVDTLIQGLESIVPDGGASLEIDAVAALSSEDGLRVALHAHVLAWSQNTSETMRSLARHDLQSEITEVLTTWDATTLALSAGPVVTSTHTAWAIYDSASDSSQVWFVAHDSQVPVQAGSPEAGSIDEMVAADGHVAWIRTYQSSMYSVHAYSLSTGTVQALGPGDEAEKFLLRGENDLITWTELRVEDVEGSLEEMGNIWVYRIASDSLVELGTSATDDVLSLIEGNAVYFHRIEGGSGDLLLDIVAVDFDGEPSEVLLLDGIPVLGFAVENGLLWMGAPYGSDWAVWDIDGMEGIETDEPIDGDPFDAVARGGWFVTRGDSTLRAIYPDGPGDFADVPGSTSTTLSFDAGAEGFAWIVADGVNFTPDLETAPTLLSLPETDASDLAIASYDVIVLGSEVPEVLAELYFDQANNLGIAILGIGTDEAGTPLGDALVALDRYGLSADDGDGDSPVTVEVTASGEGHPIFEGTAPLLSLVFENSSADVRDESSFAIDGHDADAPSVWSVLARFGPEQDLSGDPAILYFETERGTRVLLDGATPTEDDYAFWSAHRWRVLYNELTWLGRSGD